MTKVLLGLALFLICTPLLAEKSLMFSQKELQAILTKRLENHQENLSNREDCLECNGIIFQGDNNWTTWINGQKFDISCPNCPRQHLKISAVEKNRVHLEWNHKGKKHLITLSPNQYYNAASAKVITPHDHP